MGDGKSSASKPAGSPSKSSKDRPERAQMSPRSQSDPAASAMTRSFSASHTSSTTTTTKEGRPSKESLESGPIDDDDDDDDNYDDDHEEEEEEQKPTMTKRHSTLGHTNVYTECGRHGDDWLFGGISDAVKTVFGKK